VLFAHSVTIFYVQIIYGTLDRGQFKVIYSQRSWCSVYAAEGSKVIKELPLSEWDQAMMFGPTFHAPIDSWLTYDNFRNQLIYLI